MSTRLVVPVYDRRAEASGEVLVRSAVPNLRRKSCGLALDTKERKPSSGRYARDVAITSEHIDSDGDIVRAGGLDVESRYRRNPVVLLQHGRGPEFPVIGGNAVLERGTVDGKPGWIAKEWLFGDTVLGREIKALWDDGILRTTSIGFRPVTWHPIDEAGERIDVTDPKAMEEMTGFEFSESVLHEFSVVAIPANPHVSRELDGLLGMKAAAFFDLGALRKACTKCAGGHENKADPDAFGAIVAVQRAALASAAEPVDEKAFDPTGEPLPPGSVECDWAAKFLEVPVHRLYKTETEIPESRIGSFLYSFEQATREAGYEEVVTRNLNLDGGELPPLYEQIELSSTRKQSFLVAGSTFLGTPEHGIVVSRRKTWWGLLVRIHIPRADADVADGLVSRAWELARGENNFLRGEAFSLMGKFLPKTSETWDSVFLEPEHMKPLQLAAKRLNAKGKQAPSRGILLMGPPGTGKTLSIRVLRNEVKATFIWVSSRDFYYTGAFGGITHALDLARECAPSIVVFEDIDNWLSEYSIDLLKTELDGVGRHAGVVTMLTTNFPERLPKALTDRPGRFHDVLRLDLPAPALRERMIRAWLPDLTDADVAKAVEQTAGYSGAHLYELAEFAKAVQDDEELAIAEALDRALAKLKEQREAINGTQLAGSNYRPRKELVDALVAKGAHPGVLAAARAKAVPASVVWPALTQGLNTNAPLDKATADAAWRSSQVDVPRVLKMVSLERCPGCRGVNLFSREAGRFLEHRAKDGPRCAVRRLAGEPCGPTIKTIADGIRERTRDETRLAKDAIPTEALALVEALAAVGDMKALASWAGVVVKEIGELISKAGRVLSAETRRTIETQLQNIEAGIEAATMAIEAMRGAARGLKDFLAAADREDTEPEKGAATIDEAPASTAGDTQPDADPFRDPGVQSALGRLLVATR